MSKAKPSSVTTPSIPAAHACAFSCFFGIFHESFFSPFLPQAGTATSTKNSFSLPCGRVVYGEGEKGEMGNSWRRDGRRELRCSVRLGATRESGRHAIAALLPSAAAAFAARPKGGHNSPIPQFVKRQRGRGGMYCCTTLEMTATKACLPRLYSLGTYRTYMQCTVCVAFLCLFAREIN